MVKAGLSPKAALIAATRNGAEAMGLGRRTGSIKPGKQQTSWW